MMITCPNCFQQYDEELGLCPHCGYAPGENPREPFCLSPGYLLDSRFAIGLADRILPWGICYKAFDTTENRMVSVWEFYPQDLVNRMENGVYEKEPSQSDIFSREKDSFAVRSDFLLSQKLLSFPKVLFTLTENNTEYAVTELFSAAPYKLPSEMPTSVTAIEDSVSSLLSLCHDLDTLSLQGALVRGISPESLWKTEAGALTVIPLQSLIVPGMDVPTENTSSPYAPPEGNIDIRGSVYSLGATLYTMLTGQVPPAPSKRITGVSVAVANSLNTFLPSMVSAAIMQAIDLDPTRRYISCEEFASALRSNPLPSPTVPTITAPTTFTDSPTQKGKTPLFIAAVCIIIVVLVLVCIWFITSHSKDGNDTSSAISSSNLSSDPDNSSSNIISETLSEATPSPSPSPSPTPTPTPTPVPMDSVNYNIERKDHSVLDESGNILLEHYYDLVVLDGDTEAIQAINAALEADYQNFVESNKSTNQSSIEQFGGNPNLTLTNAMTGQVTYNENGVISIVHSLNWMMGGIHNVVYSAVNFDLSTGEKLTLPTLFIDIPKNSVEAYVDAKAVQYIIDNGNDGWVDNAESIVEGCSIDEMNFCIDHGEIVLLFPSYELKVGMAGPVSIPIGLAYPLPEQTDLASTLVAGSDGNGAAWSFLDDTSSPERGVNVSIGLLYLREDGTCSFMMGYYYAGGLGSQSGTYDLDGSTLSLHMRDDSTGQAYEYEYQAVLFGDAVVLTQLSMDGLFYNYPQGSVLALYDVYAAEE